MAEPPDRSNFFASVQTELTAADVSEVFRQKGWAVRKCEWTSYECSTGIAELVIEGKNPILIHGPIADISINQVVVVDLLAGHGLRGSFECYDEVGKLILKGEIGAVI